jgi:hypothetical protein
MAEPNWEAFASMNRDAVRAWKDGQITLVELEEIEAEIDEEIQEILAEPGHG